jgi:hypothetical protein
MTQPVDKEQADDLIDLMIFWMDNTLSFLGENEKKVCYHYTDSLGISSIIGNHSLWATHLSFVNDPEELEYGYAQLRETSQELLETGYSNSPITQILDGIISKIGQDTKSTYGFCLSAEGDLLSQWRGYTPPVGGYSIGFNMNKLNNNMDCGSADEISQFGILPVFYSREKQQTIILQFFNEVPKLLETLHEHSVIDEEVADMLSKRFILQLLHTIAKCFKHEGYEEENEYRLVNVEFSDKELEPKFRTRNGIVTPYVELTMKDTRKPPQKHPPKLPIEEIIIGPDLDFNLAKRGLVMLLESNGYKVKNSDDDDGIEIKRSKIPYRS